MNIIAIYSVDRYILGAAPIRSQEQIPFGISYVSTSLLRAGFNVKLIVISPYNNIEELLEDVIEEFHPKLVCLSSVTTQMPMILQAADAIKKVDSSIYTLLGGHHASLAPEAAINNDSIDAICVGEGEDASVEFAKQIAEGKHPSRITNLRIKKRDGSSVEVNDLSPFAGDLDLLPFIDREIWRPWIEVFEESALILLGRGCPFKCSYCSNHALAKLAEGKYVRFRSIENVIAELDEMTEKYHGLSHIFFEIETFGANTKYAMSLCERLERFNEKREAKLTFSVNLAVTKKVKDSHDLLDAMKRAGFSHMNVGLESGSERMRELLRRPKYSNEDLIYFCQAAEEYGIDIHFYVLVGLPGETLADYYQTIDLVKKTKPKWCWHSIYFPYQGTDLYDYAREQGLIGDALDTTSERTRAVLDLPGFPKWRIQLEYYLFNFKSRKGVWSFYKRIVYTLRAALTYFPRLEAALRKYLRLLKK